MSGGGGVRPSYMRDDSGAVSVPSGKPARQPGVLYSEDLEAHFQAMQRQHPQNVTVAPYLVGR